MRRSGTSQASATSAKIASDRRRLERRNHNRQQIGYDRGVALEIRADCLGQHRARPFMPHQKSDQDGIGRAAHQQQPAIDTDRQALAIMRTHPGRGKGNERQPEQQMQIGPQDAAVHTLGGLEHVVMIAPVNADIDEAQGIDQHMRQHRQQRGQGGFFGDLKFKDHDGDDDRNHTIGECFRASFTHHTSPSSSSPGSSG